MEPPLPLKKLSWTNFCCEQFPTWWMPRAYIYFYSDYEFKYYGLKKYIKLPVTMNMRSTKRKAVVEQGWINDRTIFGILNQFIEIAEMAVAASHSIASTVFIQYKDLTWAKPALKGKKSHNIWRFLFPLSALYQTKNRTIDFYAHYINFLY